MTRVLVLITVALMIAMFGNSSARACDPFGDPECEPGIGVHGEFVPLFGQICSVGMGPRPKPPRAFLEIRIGYADTRYKESSGENDFDESIQRICTHLLTRFRVGGWRVVSTDARDHYNPAAAEIDRASAALDKAIERMIKEQKIPGDAIAVALAKASAKR